MKGLLIAAGTLVALLIGLSIASILFAITPRTVTRTVVSSVPMEQTFPGSQGYPGWTPPNAPQRPAHTPPPVYPSPVGPLLILSAPWAFLVLIFIASFVFAVQLRRRGRRAAPAADAAFEGDVDSMLHGVDRMEERVLNLETILLDRRAS